MPGLYSSEVPPVFGETPPAVVEITLLLPTNRAEALVALSRRRGQTVGQVIRQMIEGALAAE